MNKIAVLLAAIALMAPLPAFGQAGVPNAMVVTTCGNQSYTAGTARAQTQDVTGTLCTVSGGSGGADQVNIKPNSSAAIGITPVVSGSGEASHVLKNGAGNLWSVYATNLTATTGFLVVINATSAPADGAITPLACVPLAGNSVASLNWAPGPPAVFSTGITAVVTSASTCFTKTTGVITAYISGAVQ